jgi:hypothetical protein
MPHVGTLDRAEDAGGAGGSVVPFTRASYQYREKMRVDTVLTTANQQPQVPINITPGGFLRGIWLELSGASGALNTAVVGTPTDLPWSFIASIQLDDVNGQSVFGPMSGYQLYLANKYGGYAFSPNPMTHPAFVGGSATIFTTPYFIVWIPVEIRSDALGSLANTDARAQYRLSYTVDSHANLVSGGTITTGVTLTITTWVDYWAQVEATSMAGDPQEQLPPELGTTQFWYKEVPVVATGAQTIKHNRVGNAIRTIIYIVRNGVAATSAALPADQRVNAFTDPIKLRLDNRYLFSESPNLRRRRLMADHFDLSQTDADASPVATPTKGFVDTGVYVYDWSAGLDYHPSPADEGNWLDSNEAMFLQLEVTLTGTVATCTIMTNDIAPRA